MTQNVARREEEGGGEGGREGGEGGRERGGPSGEVGGGGEKAIEWPGID